MHANSNTGIEIPGPDDLISGNVRTVPVTVAAGEYVRGEVLGLVGNVYGKLSVEDAVASAVMPFDIELAAPRTLVVYAEGDFNEDALVIGAATLADVKTELRKVGILARKWGAAPDAV
ncbi:MAG: hypothetical protein MEQ84_07845 [Mesorhizobium sp.]|nr:hypothetical protein [Mesorhizobium sp.]